MATKRIRKAAGARRTAKREIYNKYGIEFKGGKLLSPMGTWIEPLLKEGNDKTGHEVFTWSVFPGTHEYTLTVNGKDTVISGTCCCNCTGCYAMLKRYKMQNVQDSMALNTLLTVRHIDFVRRAISAQLETIGRGEVRIHAAGDFNTPNADEYAAMWHGIAETFPAFRFWTYTKVRRFEGLFDDLRNANIVKSVIPDIGVNFGHCEYVINAYYTLRSAGKKVYICRCGIDPDQHCERCGVCSAYDYVLFVEHSTNYKAQDDPLFPKLVEIVNAQ